MYCGGHIHVCLWFNARAGEDSPQALQPARRTDGVRPLLTTGSTRLLCKDRPHRGLRTFTWTPNQLPSYSLTTTVPVMSSWPSPQNTSHEKVNLPVLSGVNRILLTFPGDTLVRTPNARRLNPCSRSAEEISNTTGSPFFKVIESGLKSNFFAVM